MKNIIYIALGGSIGAVGRYLISRYFSNLYPFSGVSIGTLAVNVIGALIIGFVFSLFNYYSVSSEIKLFLMIGILGAFTTFSTFSMETINLFKQNNISYALLNIALNNVLCLIMVIVGSFAFNFLLKIKS